MTPANPHGRSYNEFIKGLWKENPVFIAVLGMCPALAVTNSVVNGLAMGLATMVVLVGSSLLVSLVRKRIPKQVRITAFIVIIATFVTAVDMTLEALAPKIHKELGAFIALIVVNCIIMGRQEAFAASNNVKLSVLDALGMSLGFIMAMVILSGLREVLGSGSFLGYSLFGPSFEPWVIMILPPGGFLVLGFVLLVFNWIKTTQDRRAKASLVSAGKEQVRP